MKIGLVRRGYSASGGAESYLRRFARALVLAGHEPVLFGSAPWPDWPGEFYAVDGGNPRQFADGLETVRPREKCDWLFSLERVWDCDCYRAGDGVHRAWLERRRPFEASWRAWFRPFSRKHRSLLKLEAHLFSRASKRLVIANSRMVRDEIVRYFGFPEARIAVIHNGIDPPAPRESREQTRQRLGLGADDYVVLFAGSGWERKGLRYAIAGVNAAQSPNIRLLVAGRSDWRELPQSSRVRFLGAVQEMPELLAASDVFLLPTIYDPFSNACLEALAAGLPVITTSANGFCEIMRETDGSVIDAPDDVAGMARALDFWSEAVIKPRRKDLPPQFSIEANVQATLALIPPSRAQPRDPVA